MKKIILLIALVAFLGVMAAPLSAATGTVAIEMVKDDKKDDKKKAEKKAEKSEKAECQEKSDCCKSKCSDDKKDDKK